MANEEKHFFYNNQQLDKYVIYKIVLLKYRPHFHISHELDIDY